MACHFFGQSMIWFIFKSEYVVSKKSAILLSWSQCINKIHLVNLSDIKKRGDMTEVQTFNNGK